MARAFRNWPVKPHAAPARPMPTDDDDSTRLQSPRAAQRAAQRVQLTYALGSDGRQGPVHHPLFELLGALHGGGSISATAAALGLSYRHVWGELRRWEVQFGHALVVWNKGQRAVLTPFGEKLLWAERRAQARLAPQIEALRMELERAFADAFDDRIDVLSVSASHDQALPLLRELALAEQLHLDLEFTGSQDALRALDSGRCQLAGFHVLDGAARGSVSARAYRARLEPGHHKLIGFAQRSQGLMVAPGNPSAWRRCRPCSTTPCAGSGARRAPARACCWKNWQSRRASRCQRALRWSSLRMWPPPRRWPAARPTWPSGSRPLRAPWGSTSCLWRARAISSSRARARWR